MVLTDSANSSTLSPFHLIQVCFMRLSEGSIQYPHKLINRRLSYKYIVKTKIKQASIIKASIARVIIRMSNICRVRSRHVGSSHINFGEVLVLIDFSNVIDRSVESGHPNQNHRRVALNEYM